MSKALDAALDGVATLICLIVIGAAFVALLPFILLGSPILIIIWAVDRLERNESKK